MKQMFSTEQLLYKQTIIKQCFKGKEFQTEHAKNLVMYRFEVKVITRRRKMLRLMRCNFMTMNNYPHFE